MNRLLKWFRDVVDQVDIETYESKYGIHFTPETLPKFGKGRELCIEKKYDVLEMKSDDPFCFVRLIPRKDKGIVVEHWEGDVLKNSTILTFKDLAQ